MAIKPKTPLKKSITKSPLISKKILIDRISISLSKKMHSPTKTQIEAILTENLEQIKKALITGEEIRFPSYFSLKITTQKARMARNLQTGKKMSVPAKRVPKVKFSSELKVQIAKKK